MKTEKVLFVICIIALIYEFLQLPGSGIFIFLSLVAVSVIYFIAGSFFFSAETEKRQNLPFSIIAGLTLAAIPFGILYKIQHFPDHSLILGIGGISALILLVLTIYLRPKAPAELNLYYKNMLTRTSILAALAILFYVLPSSVFP